MAVKRDMPEESKNSKVVKKEHFSIVFPDDIKEPKTLKRKQMIINKKSIRGDALFYLIEKITISLSSSIRTFTSMPNLSLKSAVIFR
ncbi:Undefined function [Listeria monocytogenes N53-1]|nr:Undefined function [Listeria monocytogenes N53-1]